MCLHAKDILCPGGQEEHHRLTVLRQYSAGLHHGLSVGGVDRVFVFLNTAVYILHLGTVDIEAAGHAVIIRLRHRRFVYLFRRCFQRFECQLLIGQALQTAIRLHYHPRHIVAVGRQTTEIQLRDLCRIGHIR